jgi:hypothetical protein
LVTRAFGVIPFRRVMNFPHPVFGAICRIHYERGLLAAIAVNVGAQNSSELTLQYSPLDDGNHSVAFLFDEQSRLSLPPTPSYPIRTRGNFRRVSEELRKNRTGW